MRSAPRSTWQFVFAEVGVGKALAHRRVEVLFVPEQRAERLLVPHMHVVEALGRIVAGDLEQRVLGAARHIGEAALTGRLDAARARLGDLRLGQAERVADRGPGVAADQHRAALVGRIERPHLDLRPLLERGDGRLRILDVPAEMPDRALRPGRRRRLDLVEQDQHVVRRCQRRQPAPARLAGARELPRVEIDRRVRIDRAQMQMVKAGGRQHGASPQRRCPTMRLARPKSTRAPQFSPKLRRHTAARRGSASTRNAIA